jgi:hypothetical protein
MTKVPKNLSLEPEAIERGERYGQDDSPLILR